MTPKGEHTMSHLHSHRYPSLWNLFQDTDGALFDSALPEITGGDEGILEAVTREDRLPDAHPSEIATGGGSFKPLASSIHAGFHCGVVFL